MRLAATAAGAVLARLVVVCVLLHEVCHVCHALSVVQERDTSVRLESLEWDQEEEVCKPLQEAWWKFILREGEGYKDDLVEAMVRAADTERRDAEEARLNLNTRLRNHELSRRVNLMAQPGPALLAAEDYRKVAEFQVQASIQQRTPSGFLSYGPESIENVSLADVGSLMASNRNESHLREVWEAWQKAQGPSDLEAWSTFLEFTNGEADLNVGEDVQGYWETLSEWPQGYGKAAKLWRDIEPLYRKFHDFVRRRLQNKYEDVPHQIPVHMLGSPLGYDWSHVADLVLLQPEIYSEIQSNIQQQGLGGAAAYSRAAAAVSSLIPELLQEDPLISESESMFNVSCPGQIFRDCSDERVRVLTCGEMSWQRYLEAHEVTFRAAHFRLSAEQSFLFKHPHRISAVAEAVSSLGSLLGSAGVLKTGLLTRDVADPRGQAANLRLLTALRVLPRLPALLAADMCRLAESAHPSPTPALCWVRRREMQGVAPPDPGAPVLWDALADSRFTSNTPYLSEFAGLILQFQLLDHLAQNVSRRGGDLYTGSLLERLKLDHNMRRLLSKGFYSEWPNLLSEFGIHEISAQPLLNFFKPLSPLFEDMSTVDFIPDEEIEEEEVIPEDTPAPTLPPPTNIPPPAEEAAPTTPPPPEHVTDVEVFDNTTHDENIEISLPIDDPTLSNSTTFIAIAGVILGVSIVVASVFLLNRRRKHRVERRRHIIYDPVMRHSVGRPASFSPVVAKRLSENGEPAPLPKFTTFKELDELQEVKLSEPADDVIKATD